MMINDMKTQAQNERQLAEKTIAEEKDMQIAALTNKLENQTQQNLYL